MNSPLAPSHAAGGESTGSGGLASTGVDIGLLTAIGLLLILCGVMITMRWRTARNH